MTDALGTWFAPGWCTKRTPAKTVILEIIIIIGMNTSPRRLPKTKKSQFSGICRQIRIGNCQRTRLIVIKDNANQCCKLIDVSVPSDRNTSTKVNEELSKCKDLEIETTRMWRMRTKTVPVIVGTMDHNLHVRKIPGASNKRFAKDHPPRSRRIY